MLLALAAALTRPVPAAEEPEQGQPAPGSVLAQARARRLLLLAPDLARQRQTARLSYVGSRPLYDGDRLRGRWQPNWDHPTPGQVLEALRPRPPAGDDAPPAPRALDPGRWAVWVAAADEPDEAERALAHRPQRGDAALGLTLARSPYVLRAHPDARAVLAKACELLLEVALGDGEEETRQSALLGLAALGAAEAAYAAELPPEVRLRVVSRVSAALPTLAPPTVRCAALLLLAASHRETAAPAALLPVRALVEGAAASADEQQQALLTLGALGDVSDATRLAGAARAAPRGSPRALAAVRGLGHLAVGGTEPTRTAALQALLPLSQHADDDDLSAAEADAALARALEADTASGGVAVWRQTGAGRRLLADLAAPRPLQRLGAAWRVAALIHGLDRASAPRLPLRLVPALRRALAVYSAREDLSAEERAETWLARGFAHDAHARDLLVRAASDPAVPVRERAMALQAFGWIGAGNDRLVALLAETARTAEPEPLRHEALVALARLRRRAARDLLVAELRRSGDEPGAPDLARGLTALRRLGALGGAEGWAELRDQALDARRSVPWRAEALQALTRSLDLDAQPRASLLLVWIDPGSTSSAIRRWIEAL